MDESNKAMTRVVGIRFRKAEAIKFADASELEMHRNNYVVVQTDKGPEFGWVVREPKGLVYLQPDDEPLLTVIRKATASDFGRWEANKEMEQQAFKLARTKARELDLKMKIVDSHYTSKGQAKVIVGHRLRETVSVRYPSDEVLEWPLAQIERHSSSRN